MDELLPSIKPKIIELLDLDDDSFEDVFEKSHKIKISAGETLFNEGKYNDNVYIIASGIAEVFKEDSLINIVDPGSMLGEMSLVGVDRSTATVIAKTDMVLYKFKKYRFEVLLNKYPKLNQAIVMLTISRKIQQHDVTPKVRA